MSGDEGQSERLLCVAETLDETAGCQATNIVAISEKLLLGESSKLAVHVESRRT